MPISVFILQKGELGSLGKELSVNGQQQEEKDRSYSVLAWNVPKYMGNAKSPR